jgi:hypothetical protein
MEALQQEWTELDSMPASVREGSTVPFGRIYDRWRSLKFELTPNGDDVQAHLESPLGEPTLVRKRYGGGAMLLFRRGMIVERTDGRTFVVYGEIYDYYLALGGPGSSLGLPISYEEDAEHGGRVARFQRGDIYWREDFGAREVCGATRDRCDAGADPYTRPLVERAVNVVKRSVRRVRAKLIA